MTSAYGAGAPTYDSAELQKKQLDGRIEVAIGIRDRAQADGNQRRYQRWAQIVDELLDRRLETRGK
jgi:hypothetical protein